MPYQATIKSGIQDVVVGGNGPYQAGDVVTLTDAAYAAMDPAVFASIFTGSPVLLGVPPGSVFSVSDGYGVIGASGDPLEFGGVGPPGNGSVWGARLWIPGGKAITKVYVAVRVAGTHDGTTNPNRIAVYEDTGAAIVGTTADTPSIFTGGVGWRGAALTTPIAAQSSGRFVYVLMISRGMTNLQIPFPNNANDANGPFFSIGPETGYDHRRSFYVNSQTDLPASFNPVSYGTATSYIPLFAVT